MINLLKFLLNSQLKLKRSPVRGKTSGFTLIELLVGLVLAFLVLIPLLGFMVNILDTDRREQAKANSEQELQAALNYIARDLDQSIYIYDGFGLDQIKDQLPQIPPTDTNATSEPVLVFWKRKYLPDALPIKGKAAGDCPDQEDCDDGFVYSMVMYYLIKEGNNCNNNSAWSCTARIGRLELRGGLIDINNDPNGVQVVEGEEEDPGFELFPNTGGTLEEKMNAWVSDPDTDYNLNETPIQYLVDYIDQTTPTDNAQVPQPSCSTAGRAAPRPDGEDLDENTPYQFRKVPPETVDTTSFIACVDADKITAQVFIRGNALARIRPKDEPPLYVKSQSSYFPTASIQAQGRGTLSVDQQ